jgi:TRAP-type C4-dicarboxylate transport system permease small subunit
MGDVSQHAHTPFQRAARAFESAVAIVSRVSIALAAIACLSCFGLVCYAIAMRYFFNQPQAWSDEAVAWLVVMAVMLAIPEAQRRGEHIGVDALTEKLRGRAKRAAALLGIVAVATVAYLFLTEGVEMVEFTRMIGILSNVLPDIPLWLVQALIPVGGALLLLVTLAQTLCHLAGIEPRTVHKTRPDALE